MNHRDVCVGEYQIIARQFIKKNCRTKEERVEKEVKNIISNLLAVIPPCNYCVDMDIFCCKGHFMTPNNWRNLGNCLIPATCLVFLLGTTENNNCD